MLKRNRKMFFEEQPLPVTGLGAEGGINADTTVIDIQGSIIPFSSGTGATVQNPTAAGQSSIVLIGSGTVSTGISSTNNQFTLDNTHNFAFIMPYTATLQSIYANVVYSIGSYTPGATISFKPYIAIATAPQGSANFTINSSSITQVGSYQSPNIYPASAWQSGYQNNLNILIQEGTKVAIVGGTTGSAGSSLSFIFNGSLFFN